MACLKLLIVACLFSRGLSSSLGKQPFVLVPGITSSVLEARLTNKRPYRDCARNSSRWYTVWVSETQLGSRTHCLIDNLRVNFTNSSGCTADQAGVEIRAKGWGGTHGVDIVNPGDHPSIHIYKEMFDGLEGLGYVSNVTLKAASYDWRRFGDPCWTEDYFESLQAMVEETSRDNSGLRVKLACHSMGCQILHLFLAKASAEWKASYIDSMLALAPTFGGSSKVVSQWISGPNYPILPLALENFGRRASGTWPSLLALLPRNLPGVPKMWQDNVTLLMTPQRNYSFADIPGLVAEVGELLGSNRFGATQLSAIDRLYEKAGAPGVNLTCVYITDVATDLTASYKDNDWSTDSQPHVKVQVPGDRACPRFSAEVPCKAWGARLMPLELGGVNHVNMLFNQKIIDLVKKFAETTDALHEAEEIVV